MDDEQLDTAGEISRSNVGTSGKSARREGVCELATPAEAAEYLRTTVGKLANDRYLGIGPRYVKYGRRVLYSWHCTGTRARQQMRSNSEVSDGHGLSGYGLAPAMPLIRYSPTEYRRPGCPSATCTSRVQATECQMCCWTSTSVLTAALLGHCRHLGSFVHRRTRSHQPVHPRPLSHNRNDTSATAARSDHHALITHQLAPAEPRLGASPATT